MLEMGAVVMGRGIALASAGGNLIALFQEGFVHAKLIPLAPKKRYAWEHVDCIVFTCHRSRAALAAYPAPPRGVALGAGPDPEAGLWLVITFALLHTLIWTLALIRLKAAQDVHMDVAEAFAWARSSSGAMASIRRCWAGSRASGSGFSGRGLGHHLLAMTTLGVGLVLCYLVALRVVDRRRAFFMVVLLALYPIFNFKGFKYNPDLLQLVTLPLLVLAYLEPSAYRPRGVGIAGALALMTKYWVLTMIGAIGLAALIHPQRVKFLARRRRGWRSQPSWWR